MITKYLQVSLAFLVEVAGRLLQFIYYAPFGATTHFSHIIRQDTQISPKIL